MTDLVGQVGQRRVDLELQHGGGGMGGAHRRFAPVQHHHAVIMAGERLCHEGTGNARADDGDIAADQFPQGMHLQRRMPGIAPYGAAGAQAFFGGQFDKR